jgi:hypothetical protein
MNSAVFAECVFGRPGVELVARQIVLAAKQLELLRRYDKVKEALLCTDRAVALSDAIETGRDAKAHTAAMTSALHCRLHWGSLSMPSFRGRERSERSRNL